MTFLELLELVNEADNKLNGEQLTPDEHAELLKSQADEDEDSDEDVKKGTASTPQSDKIGKLQKDIDDTQAEYFKLSHKQDKTADRATLQQDIVGTQSEIDDIISKEIKSAEDLDNLDVLKNKLTSLNSSLAEKDKLDTLQHRLQVMYSNLAEEEKRLSLYPEVETYERKLKASARHEKKRGLQSITDLPEPDESEYTKLKAAKAEKERLEYELHTGTGKRPFAPDPTGWKGTSGLDSSVIYKNAVQEPQWFKSLKNYRKNLKTNEWETVSKSKAYNVPRLVGAVFNAVAESPMADKYIPDIDNLFKEYRDIYDRILDNVNTYKTGKMRVAKLEEQLDIARNSLSKNTKSRVDQAVRELHDLPNKIQAIEQRIEELGRSGRDETRQLIDLNGEKKFLYREYEDFRASLRKNTGDTEIPDAIVDLPDRIEEKEDEINYLKRVGGNTSRQVKELEEMQQMYNDYLDKFKGAKKKGAPRDVYSEQKYLNVRKERIEREKALSYEAYNELDEKNRELYNKLSDETLSSQKISEIGKELEEGKKIAMKEFNKYRALEIKLKEIIEKSVRNSARITRYEEEKLKKKKAAIPTIENSRQFSSTASELEKQKRLSKSFKGFENSIKYGRAALKQIKDKDINEIVEQDGKDVFPDGSYQGKDRFRDVIYIPRGDDEIPHIIVNYIKGLDGHGTRPGRDEKNYKGVKLEGYGNNDGYYQTLEKCQNALEELSSQLDSRREQLLNDLTQMLDKAVGHKFATGVSEGAINPNFNAIKAWVGLKKLQRLEYEKGELDYFPLAKYTTDPVISLYLFFNNSKLRKERRLDTRTTKRSDIERQITIACSSLPDQIDFKYLSGNDVRLKKMLEKATADMSSAINLAGETRLLPIMQEYVTGVITKREFFKRVKDTIAAPATTPSNVIPFTPDDDDGDNTFKFKGKAKTSKFKFDSGEEDQISNIIDEDVKAAFTEPVLTPQQEEEFKKEDEYITKELANIEKIQQEIDQPVNDIE